MRYIRTKLSINTFPADCESVRPSSLIHRLLERSNANPDYNHSLVAEWLIEFGDDDYPWREIGLGSDGVPVLAGPDDRNYGYWLDTNMKYDDFTGTEISSAEFTEKWDAWNTQGKSD